MDGCQPNPAITNLIPAYLGTQNEAARPPSPTTSNTTAPLTFTPTTSGTWGTSTWDSGLWGNDNTIQNTWIGITGIGYCGGTQFQSASQGLQIEWASTDIVYQAGFAGV